MARKQLMLSYPHLNPGWWSTAPPDVPQHLYRVEKAVNTIHYPPGTVLDPKRVEELCDNEDWTINVSEYKG